MIDIAWSAFAEDEPSPFRVYLLQKRFATTWPTPLFCVITDSQYRLQTWKEFASSFDVRRATLENDVLEVEYTAGRRLARRVATSKYRLTPASIELLTSERSVAEHEQCAMH